MTSLYLASGSPRRQELLAQLGVTFERIVTGIEEQRQPQESAQQYVVRLAREKAQAGVAQTAQDLPRTVPSSTPRRAARSLQMFSSSLSALLTGG